MEATYLFQGEMGNGLLRRRGTLAVTIDGVTKILEQGRLIDTFTPHRAEFLGQ